MPEQTDGARRNRRSKDLDVIPRSDGGFDFQARLIDVSLNGDYEDGGREQTIHDFAVSGSIDADLVLLDIQVTARAHPFPQCILPPTTFSCLVGQRIGREWRKTILDRFAGAAGCTHVTTLLLGLSEVITLIHFQRMNAAAPFGEISRANGEWMAGALRRGVDFSDACHGLAADGPVIARARLAAAKREILSDNSGDEADCVQLARSPGGQSPP